MDKFSLDDVRESFSSDIAAQIRSLAGAARQLDESTGLAWRPEKDGHPEFGTIARACHTIYGTCSLVDVKSLYESARLLHIVGNLGEECMRTIEDQLKLVRALTVISRHGAGALDRMLALELEHRGDEAWEEALRLREELSRWDDARRELEARREREEHDREAQEVRRAQRDASQTQAFDLPLKADDPLLAAAAAAAAAVPEPEPEPPAVVARDEFDFDDDGTREHGEMRAPWPPSAAFGAAAPPPAAVPPVHDRTEEFTFEEAEAATLPTPAPPAPTPAPAAEPAEFSFDSMIGDAPKVQASAPREYSFDEGQAPSGELREFFQQEAREYLVALQGYLQALARDPADSASAESLERIYHTLKGTAATVGLTDVSAQASELQNTMEATLAMGQPVGPAFVAQLVLRTNRLLAAGGLPQVGLETAVSAPADAARSPELQKLFWQDTAQVLMQIEEALVQLASAQDPAGEIETLRGLFHRLKGSAIVAGEAAMSDAAGRLQDLCENGTAELHPQELRRGVDQLHRLLEPGHTPLPEAAPLRETVPTDVDPVIWEAFEIESGELLESIDKAIFALETSQAPKSEISALFRYYHTLKGSVNTVGLAGLGRLVHKLEDFLENLQEAPILPPLADLATLLLNVQDEVRRNLRHAKRGFIEVHVSRLDSEIQRLRGGGKPGALARTGDSSASSPTTSGSGFSGTTDSGMGRSFRERGADASAFDRKFVRVSTERLDGLMNLTGELVVSRSRLARRVSALQTMHRELTLGRNRLIRAVDRFREQHEFETVARGARSSAARSAAVSGAAVALFGELELDRYGDVNILARSLADIGHDISQVQGRMNDSLSAFSEDAAGFGSIVTGLQTEITQARMVPVEQLFTRLRLPVRDAGEREGKPVRVQAHGEDVDLDKAIIDELYTPLLHLVRNAVAHGIEAPAARRTAGKEAMGTITLTARQEAGELLLDVQDDGGGLDYRRLHQLGLERGLLAPGTTPDDAAVADVIFHSGVSTRDDVDDVSGRGVGLDVVRREIERLGGSVRVSSLRGLGTTFTIHLPLTLAITRALILRHRGLAYAVPLNLAERILDLTESTVHDSAGQRRINVDGVYHTLRSLDVLLGLPPRTEADGVPRAAVLLRVGQTRLAVEVDRVIGQEEIVVKGLGDVLTGHPLFSGVTVSGDGELILIFDVVGLFHKDRRAGDTADAAAAVETKIRARVLFIDDSLSVRKVAERFLAALGAEVVLAADGQEGLDKLQSQARFDLVFTDLEMPRLHGYELIREMRAHAALRDLPVIVVTSRSGQKHRDQASAVGATDYITKPFSQDLLGRMIRKWAKSGGKK
jgi:chemosensory pili system protein ChpA (sensor histidine kinase/response regulator)